MDRPNVSRNGKENFPSIPIHVIHTKTSPCGEWEVLYRSRPSNSRLPDLIDVQTLTRELRPRETVVALWFEENIPSVVKKTDAWLLRERFLKLVTEVDFLQFLNEYGRLAISEDDNERGWTLEELIYLQTLIRQLSGTPVSDWDHLYIRLLTEPLERDRDLAEGKRSIISCLKERSGSRLCWHALQPVIECNDILSAIVNTIHVDQASGTPMMVCARSGCGKLYRVTGHRERKYCSLKCAHHASVTRTRQRQRGTSNEITKQPPR
jgi:hypothetical protein